MVSLSELILVLGESAVNDVVQTYVSAHEDENPEVSTYLREKAISMEKRDLSRTYVSITEDLEIRGFVTLGIKCMTVPDDNLLSNSAQRRMNIEFETHVSQAFLLGQLSRSEASAPGQGREFMAFALEMLGEAKRIVGCRVVRLDCKDDLTEYYEDMGIDTPEKAAAIEDLFAHPEKYTYHCQGIDRYQWADEEFLQRLREKYCRQSGGIQGQAD